MKFTPDFLDRVQSSAAQVRNSAALAAITCFGIGSEAGYPSETVAPFVEFTVGALAFHALYQAVEKFQ